MNNFKYSSGKYDIIDSGVLYAFGRNDNIEYDMDIVATKVNDLEIRYKMKIIFQFVDDGKELTIERKVDADNKLVHFICYNFNNSLGSGTNEPVELAIVAEKRLFIHMWVFLLGNSARKMEYAIFFERAGGK